MADNINSSTYEKEFCFLFIICVQYFGNFLPKN